MAELERQWPLSSGRQKEDLLARAEEMNRAARESSRQASPMEKMPTPARSSSPASPSTPTGSRTSAWEPKQWPGESDQEFHYRMFGWRDEKSGTCYECEVIEDEDA